MQLTSAGKEPSTHPLSSQGSGYSGKLALTQPLLHFPESDTGSALSAEDTAQTMCMSPHYKPPAVASVAPQGCKLVDSPAAQTNTRRFNSVSSSLGRAKSSRPMVADKHATCPGHPSQTKSQYRHVNNACPQPELTASHTQLRDRLQTNLVAAHAVGYCNGIRHTRAKSSLIFSRDAARASFESSSASNQTLVHVLHQHRQHSDARQPASAAQRAFASTAAVSTASLHSQQERSSIPIHHHKQQQQQQQQTRQQPSMPSGHQQREQGHAQQHRQSHQQLQPPCSDADLLDSAGHASQNCQTQCRAVEAAPQCFGAAKGQQRGLGSIARPTEGNPKPHIRFRCEIQDLLDTHFAGWDSNPAENAPPSSAHATAATSDRPLDSTSNSQHTRPTKAPLLQSTQSDAASANSAPPDAPPAPQPAVARVPISRLTVPSTLLSTGSSSNLGLAASASLTEEEARQAMPPPRGQRATAESVQAAVAAAQQEEWATVAHAAAWGTSFPGVVPFAQMGAAAWNIAFPQQVAEVMTCTGTRRFPKPAPFVPPTFGPFAACPPALQPPSASTGCSSSQNDAESLRKAASMSTMGSADAHTARQLPGCAPLFSYYPSEAVLPGPQPWGVSKRPYVLSSLPQVMQQLMEESSTDFLHSWTLAHLPNQAADAPSEQLPAKKQRHNRRPEAAVAPTSRTGLSERQSAGETAQPGHQQFTETGSTADQVTASILPQQSAMREAEAKMTPLQMMKQRARQRVAAAVAPRTQSSSSMSLK